MNEQLPAPVTEAPLTQKPSRWLRFKGWVRQHPYWFIGIILLICALIFAGVVAYQRYFKKESASIFGPKVQQSKDIICPLDGTKVEQGLANRHPLAVVVENLAPARPQSGLTQASIVYEAITEGGITRFLAIFGPKNAEEIGPIRSARMFFIDWLSEYDALFAHAGGNEDALGFLDSDGSYVKNLDHSGNYFWRDYKGRSVASEHTLYSNTEKLYQYASDRGFDVSSYSPGFRALKFKQDLSVSQRPASQTVTIDFSTPSYKATWQYNNADNNYARVLAGEPQKDRVNDQQISAKNIIIQKVDRQLDPHGSFGGENWIFTTTGEGPAKIVRDGQVVEATWKKAGRKDRTLFYDSAGKEIEFNAGQTWYEIVPDMGLVTVE